MADKTNKTEAAFSAYLLDPIVQRALAMTEGDLVRNLLKDCFMRGAGYAIERCKAEHHQPKSS